jgi:hypothetical protein
MSLSVRFAGQHAGMDAMLALFALFAPWMVFVAFAEALGKDSRDTMPDDHQR